MKIEDIKNEMIAYRDFFGGDLLGVDEVKSAKSKKDLSDIIDKHHDYIGDMANDAQCSLDRFKQKLGLSSF